MQGAHFSLPLVFVAGTGASSSFLPESKPLTGSAATEITRRNRFTSVEARRPCISNPKMDWILITKVFVLWDLILDGKKIGKEGLEKVRECGLVTLLGAWKL